MVHRYAAFIRGINVGRAKRVAMADLKQRLAAAGLRDVTTLLNSGNVIFQFDGSADDAATIVRNVLSGGIGVPAEVVVLTAAELRAIADANLLLEDDTDPSRLFVTIFGSRADRERAKLLTETDWGTDRLVVGDRAVYAGCPAGAAESPLAKAVLRATSPTSTNRNWATILKVLKLLES